MSGIRNGLPAVIHKFVTSWSCNELYRSLSVDHVLRTRLHSQITIAWFLSQSYLTFALQDINHEGRCGWVARRYQCVTGEKCTGSGKAEWAWLIDPVSIEIPKTENKTYRVSIRWRIKVWKLVQSTQLMSKFVLENMMIIRVGAKIPHQDGTIADPFSQTIMIVPLPLIKSAALMALVLLSRSATNVHSSNQVTRSSILEVLSDRAPMPNYSLWTKEALDTSLRHWTSSSLPQCPWLTSRHMKHSLRGSKSPFLSALTSLNMLEFWLSMELVVLGLWQLKSLAGFSIYQ